MAKLTIIVKKVLTNIYKWGNISLDLSINIKVLTFNI